MKVAKVSFRNGAYSETKYHKRPQKGASPQDCIELHVHPADADEKEHCSTILMTPGEANDIIWELSKAILLAANDDRPWFHIDK